MSNQAYQLHSRAAQADSLLKAAVNNAAHPTQANGALQTGNTSWYVGFDKLPTANKLIGDLETTSNQLTLHLTGDSFSATDCKVHVEGGSGISVLLSGLLGISASASAEVDVKNFTSEKTSFSLDITYPGLTTVGALPLSLSSDGKTGWYVVNILREIQEKTGNNNVDGYKLLGTEFSVRELFGPEGKLNFLKSLVISQEPTIDVTFNPIL